MFIFKTIIVFCCTIFLSSCFDRIDDEWTVITVGLPETLTTQNALHNMTLYILKQTHEPYFFASKGGYKSNIFESWTRNQTNDMFKFCLTKGLVFYDKVEFTPERAKSALRQLFVGEKISADIRSVKNCLVLKFESPFKSLFEFLSRYEFAPTEKFKGKKFEVGLGKYIVSSIGDKHILLKRKKLSSEKFNYISFSDYEDKFDPILSKSGVEDYNRVLLSDFPYGMTKNYKKYDITLLQTFNLAIDVVDEKLREVIFHCLDVGELRRAYMPNQKEFFNVKNILPVGIPGAEHSLAKQDCDRALSKVKSDISGKKLVFSNWAQGNQNQLETLFNNFNSKTKIDVKIENISLSEFVKNVFLKDNKYELFVFALDAVKLDISSFFDAVHGPKSLMKQELKSVAQQYSKVFSKIGEDRPTEEVVKLAELFSSEHLILPLYQEKRIFFYPDYISGLNFGRDFLEYPIVDQIVYEK